MTSSEIRTRFLEFFRKRGHSIIPSASLVPENDPSVLFNTAGMQPLVPYLLGETHPAGTRLVNIQKCVRTNDIDEVGDNTHDTFFEMLGNWSLGDYFKRETIEWSYEFLTSPTEGLGLNPERLYVTCFQGNEDAPQDEESSAIWREIFDKNSVKGERIYFMPAKDNWWSAGDNGPCGPDTEMFYDLTGGLTAGMSLAEYVKASEEQKVVEIWNDVFMQYLKKDGKVVGKLDAQNVDTGSGLERVTMVMQGKTNIFDTDLFSSSISHIRESATKQNIISERIVADHVRAAVFMIADGVLPSNTDRGYVLRRLIRRAVRHADTMGLPSGFLGSLVPLVASVYAGVYSEVVVAQARIAEDIAAEEEKFRKTLAAGLKQFEKISRMSIPQQDSELAGESIESSEEALPSEISGADAFVLFSTYGFPIELTMELAREKGMFVDRAEFQKQLAAHQDISRAGSEQKFKGGMGGSGETETKYHTATHLLHQALRDVLGEHVQQKGSNITAERLRFDFTHGEKMTDEQKKQVEDTINGKIAQSLPMHKVVMRKEDAEKTGALHFFGDKYGDEVSVYYIGDTLETAYSKEFCGGPHVENISTLGHFKIIKEESVSTGVRRIKAVLE